MSGEEQPTHTYEPETDSTPKRTRWTPADGITRERKWYFFAPVTLWIGAAFVLSFFGVRLIAWILSLFGLTFKNVDSNVFATGASAVVYLLLLAITLGIPRLLKLWSGKIDYPRLLGLTSLLKWRHILYALVGFIVYLVLGVALVSLVGLVIPGFNANQTQDLGFTKTLTSQNATYVFIALVLIAPVAEEIIFRGYLFGTLRRSVPVVVAALITSAVFGLIHGQWNVGLDVFVLSLVSCFLRYRSGSLWPSMLLHMAKNGLAFYVLYVASGSII